jgi:hypothetical protein
MERGELRERGGAGVDAVEEKVGLGKYVGDTEIRSGLDDLRPADTRQ